MPSGLKDRTSDAVTSHGKTLTWQFRAIMLRRMFHLTPKSMTAMRRGRLRSLTSVSTPARWDLIISSSAGRVPAVPSPFQSNSSSVATSSTQSWSPYHWAAFNTVFAAAVSSPWTIAPIMTPVDRMRRVMARVSTPETPAMPLVSRYSWTVISE